MIEMANGQMPGTGELARRPFLETEVRREPRVAQVQATEEGERGRDQGR